MTTANEIVKEEFALQVKGTAVLSLFTYAAFAMTGRFGFSIFISLLLGAAYSLYLFFAVSSAAVRSLRFDNPTKAQVYMTRGYIFRYGITAVYILCAVRFSFLNPLACVIPLFYAKIILLISKRKSRKGG